MMSDTVAASDAATAFFEERGRRGRESLLAKGRGTVCVELTNGTETQPWLVTIDRGDVKVLQGTGHADCTLRTSRELFEQIVTGEVNAVAAILRGAIGITGNWQLLVLFQRLFPGPPKTSAATADTGATGSSG